MNTRELCFDQIRRYCNEESFVGVENDALPLVVQMAADQMVSALNNRSAGISSKTDAQGVEVDYRAEAMSKEVKQMLSSYRNMRW